MVVVGLVILLTTTRFRVYKVVGDSMLNSYHDNQFVIVDTLGFRSKPISYLLDKDVVIYLDILDINSLLIKRVTKVDNTNKKIYVESLNKNGNFLDSEDFGWLSITKVKGVVR